MRILVTGAAGQLGYDLVQSALSKGHEVIATDIVDEYKIMDDLLKYCFLDITDAVAVKEIITKHNPELVVHCAAWTAVDLAEKDENRKKVYNLNVEGTKNIAKACKITGAELIYISTDYVFDGTGKEPWKPEDDTYAPINYYGETKLLGEEAVTEILEKYYIIRISWVFGLAGSNFVKTMIRVGQNNAQVRVVNDQIGTPTYTKDLAELVLEIAGSEKYGYYHASNEGGYISWFDFTREIYAQCGLATEVLPVSTEEYGESLAKRPLNSRLDKSKLSENGFSPMPDWKDALKRFLAELKEKEQWEK